MKGVEHCRLVLREVMNHSKVILSVTVVFLVERPCQKLEANLKLDQIIVIYFKIYTCVTSSGTVYVTYKLQCLDNINLF